MPKFYLFLAVVVAAISYTSCNSKPSIEGVWTGAPTTLVDQGYRPSTGIILSYTFENAAGTADHGTVLMSALIDYNHVLTAYDHANVASDSQTSYRVNAAATASVKGKWAFEKGEDDDVLIVPDFSTFTIDVRPHSIQCSPAYGSGPDHRQVSDSVKTVLAREIEQRLESTVKERFISSTSISDIKVAKGMLTCEIADRDYTFHHSAE